MNNLIWLLRAAKWARNPPSARTVKLVLAIVVVAIVIFAAEQLGIWPEWAQMERIRGVPRPPG